MQHITLPSDRLLMPATAARLSAAAVITNYNWRFSQHVIFVDVFV
jgi:hypothetical protein